MLSASSAWQRSDAGTADALALPQIDFRTAVRPILSRACFECHGPDESARRADLRLDRADAGLERVIVPGASSASLLYERLVTADPDDRMPPIDSHRVLTEEQKTKMKDAFQRRGGPGGPGGDRKPEGDKKPEEKK